MSADIMEFLRAPLSGDERALVEEIFRYEANIDGEWGCGHTANQIAAGNCPEIQPDAIKALRILAALCGGKS